MKKTGYLPAFLLLLITLACACGEKPKPEEVRLVIKTPMQEMNTVSRPDIRDTTSFLKQASSIFAAQYRDARVRPEVKTFNYVDELRAVTDSFDTETAPDVLFGATFNLSGYIDMGRVAPLDDILDEGLLADIAPEIWEMARRDGRVYVLPFLTMQNILIYNKSLFRQCGLERFIGKGLEIQNWSLKDWKTILDTLAEKLPHGKYPIAMFAKNNQGDTHMLTYLRSFGGRIFNDRGDFDFQDPLVVRALSWLQEGVRRGWFPPHPENLEMKDCSELFANGQLAIYMFNNANRALYTHLPEYGFVNYPGNHATNFCNGFVVFDNNDPRRLRAAKELLRFIFATDEWRDVSAGNIPVSRRTLEKYRDKIVMLDEFSKNSVNVVDFMNKSPNWQGRDDSFRSVFWPNINKLLALRISPEQCAADLDRVCNRALETGRSNRRLHP